jgi:hypothetical protein
MMYKSESREVQYEAEIANNIGNTPVEADKRPTRVTTPPNHQPHSTRDFSIKKCSITAAITAIELPETGEKAQLSQSCSREL